MSRNSPQVLKKKRPVKKLWKGVPSKRSVTTADPKQFVQALKKQYPDAHCELNFKNPFELVIATILSAQCTDVRVNQVTKKLFEEYPTPETLAQAPQEKIEAIIRSTGFFKNKAKNIIACSKTLVERHQGRVPKVMEELTELAGVGRKTANVVMGNAFEIASGIVVDTHVSRLSARFGWTQSQDPVIIERQLLTKIAKQDWILFSHLLIWHGRKICKARNPQCEQCFLFDRCPRIGIK